MKKITLAIITLAFFTGLFLSCSKKQNGEAEFKPRLATDTKCQIRVVGNYKNFEALESEFDRFNEFYPNVEFSYIYLDNYKATIKSALASDSAPDIFMNFFWMLDKPNYKEVFDCAEDMSDEEKLGFNLSTIQRQLIDQTSDGKIPMIPVLTASYGMMVNEDLFKKEGLSVPLEYEQLITTCKKLKEAGYKSPIMAYDDTFMVLPMVFAYFCKSIQKMPGSVALLNKLDPSAGQYLRPSLEWTQAFMKEGLIDFEECHTLKDKYNDVILRFFEGNIPIMLCHADTVSGTLKRESQSNAFMNNPFEYSFYPFPAENNCSDFVNQVSVAFSVNKNSKNLEMANEFMRFLVRTEELNNLAKIKRLITVSTDYSVDEIYEPFSKSNSIYLEEIGLMDNAIAQMRKAVYQVMIGEMTVEQAMANYGNF